MSNSNWSLYYFKESFVHASLRKNVSIYHFKIKVFEVHITRIRRIFKVWNTGSLLKRLQHSCSNASCHLAKLHQKKQPFLFRCLGARLFLNFLSEHQFTALFLNRHPPAYTFRYPVTDGSETNLQFTIGKLSWFNNEHDEM